METRREQSSLTFFYKIHSGTVSLDKDNNNIIIIINSLFKEDDILSKYNYLSNIWSSATKQTNNMDRIVQYIHAMRI